MVKRVALYPGQGSQRSEMALDLYHTEREVKTYFELASDLTSTNIYTLLSKSEEELKQSEIAQIAITVASQSALIALRRRGISPQIHAGFSLGELSAYAASGVITQESLLQIVQKRGSLMAKATEMVKREGRDLTMAALIGVDFATVSQALLEREVDELYCANENSPTQVVVSGRASLVESYTPLFKELGAKRVVPLKVSGPFHTPFMERVVPEFTHFLTTISFSNPKGELYLNYSGTIASTKEEIRECCVQNLSNPVRWQTIMEDIGKREDVSALLEVGPSGVLSRLAKENGVNIPAYRAGTVEEIELLIKESI